MIIYNLFPRLAGALSQWGTHISRAADLGFDWIYVNPLQQPGGRRPGAEPSGGDGLIRVEIHDPVEESAAA